MKTLDQLYKVSNESGTNLVLAIQELSQQTHGYKTDRVQQLIKAEQAFEQLAQAFPKWHDAIQAVVYAEGRFKNWKQPRKHPSNSVTCCECGEKYNPNNTTCCEDA